MTTSTLQQLLIQAARNLELHNEEYSHRTSADLIYDLKIKANLLSPTAVQIAVHDCGFADRDLHKVDRLLTKLRIL